MKEKPHKKQSSSSKSKKHSKNKKSASSESSTESSSSSGSESSSSSDSSIDDDNKSTQTTDNIDNDEPPQSNYQPDQSNECSGDVLAIVPETFCVDWVPGIGFSQECDAKETEKRGGQVCNIVSTGWLRVLNKEGYNVDVVLVHAGTCQADIPQGALKQKDIDDILPKGFNVVFVKMYGKDIDEALQQGAKAALNGNPEAFPYGAGIRFKVDYKNRNNVEGYVYDIEMKPGGYGGAESWQPLDPNRLYSVATNSQLADAGSGYDAFLNVSEKQILAYTDAELFTKYVTSKCELDEEGAPYSTLNFIGLDVLLAEEPYQCLEDVGLCSCGLC